MIEKYAFDLVRDDFKASDWEAAIQSVTPLIVEYYNNALTIKAQTETEDRKKAVLVFLAAVTFIHLSPDFEGKPLPSSDFYSEEDIAFLADIFEEISDIELKSRVADILWGKKRRPEYADAAIISYLESAKRLGAVDGGRWSYYRLDRALNIAGVSKRNNESVIEFIIEKLDELNGDDQTDYSANLMGLLVSRKKGDPIKYATFCEKLATAAESRNEYERAVHYWDCQVSWHNLAKDTEAWRKSNLKIGECFEKQSEYFFKNHSLPNTMAGYALLKALKVYRNHGQSADKIEKIKFRIRERQKASMNEMVPIPTSPVPVDDAVEATRKIISGKIFQQAVLLLAKEIELPRVETLHEYAITIRDQYLFGHLFSEVMLATDGRTTAREPDDIEVALHKKMYGIADRLRVGIVNGFIETAREVILREHYFNEWDYLQFLVENPFVVPGREQIIAKGLHAGFTGDFVVAAHLLIPQIEHSLRYFLSEFKLATAKFDDKGIQDEMDLNHFLTNEKYTKPLKKILGEDFIFDLRGLLIERFGANLRNNMAHGLLNLREFYTVETVYLWWLALRFYLIMPLKVLDLYDAEDSNRTSVENTPECD